MVRHHGGWGASELRGILNGSLYIEAIEELKIKSVQKEYSPNIDGNTMLESSDYLWCLSAYEMYTNMSGNKNNGRAPANERETIFVL